MERLRQLFGEGWVVKIVCVIGLTCMTLGFVCMIMGFNLLRQMRNDNVNVSDKSVEEISAQLIQTANERDNYKRQLIILKQKSEKTISELKIQAGVTPLEGQGILITLNDSSKPARVGEDQNSYVIHDEDILRVVNELRAAGAKAISINGQRLIATSEIRCAGPTLSVNNVRSSAPFEIRAVGDKKNLENSVKMRGGVEESLKVWGIEIYIEVSDNVYIPPYKP